MFDDEVPLWEYPLIGNIFSYCWPDRKYVVEPIFDREAIIMADFDLNAIDREKMTLDVSGITVDRTFLISKSARRADRVHHVGNNIAPWVSYNLNSPVHLQKSWRCARPNNRKKK